MLLAYYLEAAEMQRYVSTSAVGCLAWFNYIGAMAIFVIQYWAVLADPVTIALVSCFVLVTTALCFRATSLGARWGAQVRPTQDLDLF